jgi:hypothetical protein
MTAAEFFGQDPLPDGNPLPRSTYDCVEFLSDSGALWVHGGERAYDRTGALTTWVFDSTSAWSQRSDGFGGHDIACAYDPSSRRIFAHHPYALSIYDVERNTWDRNEDWAFPPLWPRYSVPDAHTATIDPKRGLFWSVGGICRTTGCRGTVLVWDIAASRPVTDEWRTTGGGAYTNRETAEPYYPEQVFESGGGAIYYASAPGIDYDSAADDLVAWPNQGPPYALDLETKEWTVGGDIGAPESNVDASGGTFGRWRYIAPYNVFVLVNSVDENVYFYKHTSGCGSG